MKLRLLVIVFSLSLIAAACGDTDSRTQATSAPATTEAPAAIGTPAATESPATTEVFTSEDAMTESDALEIVEAYYTAAAAGDADAIAGTFAEAPATTGTADFAEHLNFLVWDAAQGTVLVDRTCAVTGAESESIAVVCEYGNHQYLQRVVGAPATTLTETFTVTTDGIEEVDSIYSGPLFPANDAFNGWMLANHPQDAAAADCCGEDGSMEDALADGELRRQYAELWTTHLAETGCTYTDIGC